MLKCVLCGADLGEHDGYVRGSISGEILESTRKMNIIERIRFALFGKAEFHFHPYAVGRISGEVMELSDGPKVTGQKNSWEGVAFCLKHFEDIPKNIAENLGLIAKKRELEKNDNRH